MTSSRILRFALPILLFLGLCFAFFPESIDDAYITLRYSLNVMQGNGPVFNLGEHVEGYSNLVWMCLLAATGKLGLSMPIMMKVYGVCAGIATIVFAGRLTEREYGRAAATTVMFALAGSTFFALWAVDGLETMFYTSLVTCLFVLLLSTSSTSLVMGIVGSLVALTRPEGIMFGLLACAYVAWTRGLKQSAGVLLPLAISVGAYEVFRFEYFGELVSNTALTKVHTSTETVMRGMRYLLAFDARSGFLILPAAIAGAWIHRKKRLVLLGAGFVAAQILFLAVSGGDFMYGYRFVLPVVPVIVILASGCLSDDILKRPVARTAAGAAFVIVIASFQMWNLPPKDIDTGNLVERRSVHFEIADYLRANTSPNDTVVVSEAGIIPFGISAKIYDYLGLVTPFRRVFNPDGSLNVEHALDKDPKFVMLTLAEDRSGKLAPRMKVEREILENQEFTSHYTPVRRFYIDSTASYLNQIYYRFVPDAQRIYFLIYERRTS